VEKRSLIYTSIYTIKGDAGTCKMFLIKLISMQSKLCDYKLAIAK